MNTKIINCIDCGCDVVITKYDGRTKRCKEHQTKFYKENQRKYHKNYPRKNRPKRPESTTGKRTYIRQNISQTSDIEYCHSNWEKVDGCLNCICKECIQPEDYDKMLPWENEGFYTDDKTIDYYVPERELI